MELYYIFLVDFLFYFSCESIKIFNFIKFNARKTKETIRNNNFTCFPCVKLDEIEIALYFKLYTSILILLYKRMRKDVST